MDHIPHKLSFSREKLPKRVVLSYVFDYVIIIALWVIFVAQDAVEPFHQHFALQNYTLQYPFALVERVPVYWLYFTAVVCPAAIIAIYTLIVDGLFSHSSSDGGRLTFKKRLWELNCGLLGLLLSSSAAYVVTEALKNTTGKPRPDLIDRCQPRVGSVDPPVFGLSNSTICTQTNHAILKDGFRSFPSGHSSTAFAGLFYLSLFIAGKLHVLDNRGEAWKAFIVLIPTLSAALIAVTRIMDARHHPFDVITGSLLGTLTAYCAYRQYFPPLTEAWRMGRAYPIRSWGTEPLGPESSNREIARDQGVEPLRTTRMPVPLDEEHANAYGPEGSGSGSGSARPQGSPNVFREQISNSMRRRNNDRQDVEPPQPGGGGGAGTGGDEYYTSLENDRNEHGEIHPTYEMQPQSIMRPDIDHQGHMPVESSSRTRLGDMDTAYHGPPSPLRIQE